MTIRTGGVNAEQLALLVERVEAISGSCIWCGLIEELVKALERCAHDKSTVALVETNGTTYGEELIEML
jgi:hypothetical protein